MLRLFIHFLNLYYMQNAVAFSNNDVITIAWSLDPKPDGCMGFAIFRINEKREETPLPSHAVFPEFTIQKGQTTKEFPVQKFYWKDVYAREEAAKSMSNKFRYKIVPLQGTPGALVAMASAPFMITNEIEISPVMSENISAYFNRGLISTQRISDEFNGHPQKASLLERIADPQDELRKSLAGEMIAALTGFLDQAKDTGKIYAALYELHDTELITKLTALKDRLYLVLSNSAIQLDDKTKPSYTDKNGKQKYQIAGDDNDGARKLVHSSSANIYDRMMTTGHIGHNKFLVYVDEHDIPQAVLCGSTNWTCTGLCAQTNNSLFIKDQGLAKRYLAYWQELVADTKLAGTTYKLLQGPAQRAWDADAKGTVLAVPNTSVVNSWFSPNTSKSRKSNPSKELRPPDMNVVVDYINNAKQAILFLAFYPGSPSIANWAADALKNRKDLFVRGCVTNNSAAQGFYYELKGIPVPPKSKDAPAAVKQDFRVFAAEAFDKAMPDQWKQEILSAGFAIIHDKIMVIDPFSDDAVVITGSHNLGHRASYNNDENLIIVKGNKKLAMAYASHVLDVYDHFASRYAFKHFKDPENNYYLKLKPDDWMGKYFGPDGKIKTAQLKFWMTANGN